MLVGSEGGWRGLWVRRGVGDCVGPILFSWALVVFGIRIWGFGILYNEDR